MVWAPKQGKNIWAPSRFLGIHKFKIVHIQLEDGQAEKNSNSAQFDPGKHKSSLNNRRPHSGSNQTYNLILL